MNTIERRQRPPRLVVTRTGALLDLAAYDALLASWARTAEANRVHVRRLSVEPGPDQLPELPR